MNSDRAQPPVESNTRIAAGAGLVLIARLAGGLFNLLLLIVLARLLDKPTFAVVILVYMLQEIIVALGTLDIQTALYYFVPKLGPSKARALGIWTAFYLTLLALPFALALWLLGPNLANILKTPEAASIFGFVAIYILADFPSQALPNYLLGRRMYNGFTIVSLVFYGSRFASLVVPAALNASLNGMMACFMLVALLRCAMLIWLLAFIEKGSLKKQGFTLRELLNYSLPLSLSTIVHKLGIHVDKYIIVTLCSAEVFAVYSIGAREIPLVSSIAYSVTAALMPTLVILGGHRQIGPFLDLWHSSILKVAAVMMPIFFLFFIMAEPIVTLMFTESYAAAATPFRIFLCLLPLRLCAYGAVVRSLGLTRPVFYSSLAALAVNAALSYPLYLLLGLPGPAVAAVTGELVTIFWLLSTVRRTLKTEWCQVFPVRGVAARFVIAGSAALPLWILPSMVESNIAQLVIGILILVPLYLILTLTTGVVSRADLSYLKDLVTMRIISKTRQHQGEKM